MILTPNKTFRSFFFRLVTAVAIVFFFATLARAGGPKYVAGSSYFNTSTMGQPITWSLGQVKYYTDQGDLSPIMTNSAANAFVASAFSKWTSASSAALSATNAGHLAEDVNGGNIAANSDGVVTAPADITSSATQTPVGIVYDYDGSVTNALLGAGAGNSSQCFSNAVYGGADNYSASGNFLHALVVINGQCVQQTSQMTDVQYRLLRVLGEVIGMGWSQLNLNAITGRPHPTPDDFAGFPLMHFIDSFSCVPISICYANPFQFASDDVAELLRLYPASSGNLGAARIHGSVHFVDHTGSAVQPMQGVNVVARWIDPSTGQPSHKYSATSVSGFLFTGNAGNPITGLSDPLGNMYSEFGSSDQTMEGFFDLGELPIPDGGGSAQYQLAVEALDPLWSTGVAPYDSGQVAPSGVFQPIVVTVSAGGDVAQDILMSASAQTVPSWAATETWTAPATVPAAGDWVGSLSGYGDVGYFVIFAQANRTLSVAVTALDETGAPSESKLAPVVGMWSLGDPQGTVPPALTPAPFNETFGMTRLDAQVFTANSFIIGVADLRGDGRPDYRYHAHVLYGDSVSPQRLPVSGGVITLQGTGFAPGLTISVGSTSEALLAINTGQMRAATSAQSDGPQTITVNDPVSGAFSIMTNALTFGAAASDKIVLLQGANPPTPVGTQAANPMSVRVVAADGITPVNGATVGWSTTNGAALSICSGASSCSAISDESGVASTWVTPGATGNATITATLAPGVYSPAQSVSGTMTATSSLLDIGVTTPFVWIASGASVSVPLTARVVSQGTPRVGATVNFFIAQGIGSLSAASAVTNTGGYASVTLTLTNFTANIQLSVCVAPGNNPCQTIYGNAVAAALLNLQAVGGEGQVIAGTAFQPLIARVTDSSKPPNPVLGASVVFQSNVLRPLGDDSTGMPVILSTGQSSAQSDVNGLVSFLPSLGSFRAPLEVEIQVSAGAGALLQTEMESFPEGGVGGDSPPVRNPGHGILHSSWGPLREPGGDDRREDR